MTPKSYLRGSVAVIAMIAASSSAVAQSTLFREDGRAELRRVQSNVALRYLDALTIAHRIIAEDLRVTRTQRLSNDLATTDRPPPDYTGIDQRLITDYGLRARFCDGGLLTYLDPDTFSAGVTPRQIHVASVSKRRIGKANDPITGRGTGFIENGDFVSPFGLDVDLADCFASDYADPLPNGRPALFTTVEPLTSDVYNFAVDTFRHEACEAGDVGGGVLYANTNTFVRMRNGDARQTSFNLNEIIVQDLCREPVRGTREVVRPCTLTIAGQDLPSTFTVSTPYTEIPDPNDPFATIIDFSGVGTIIRSRCSAIPPDGPTVNTTGIDEVIVTPLACPVEFPEGERFGEHTVTTTTTSFSTGQPDIINVFATDVTESVNDCYRLEARLRDTASRSQCEAPFSGGTFDTTTTTEETFQVFADGRDDVLVENSAIVTNEQTTSNLCFTDITVFEEDPVVFSCGEAALSAIVLTGEINAIYTQAVVIRDFEDPNFQDQELSRTDQSVEVISNTCNCFVHERSAARCPEEYNQGYDAGAVIDAGHNPDQDGLGIEGFGAAVGATDSTDAAAAAAGASGGDGGGGACVIYTELETQHRLSRGDLILNWYWTQKRYADPAHMIRGYQFWAKPIVARMKISPHLSDVVARLARARLSEIEYQLGRRERSSLAGKMVRLVAEPLSWALGFFAPPLSGEGRKAPHGPIKEIINA